MAYNIPEHLKGLTEEQLQRSREEFGYNQMTDMQRHTWLEMLLGIMKEPMLILLFAISIIYLMVGDYGEAAFMLVAIILVSAISFYQDNRSRKALEALEKLNEPLSTVIRNGQVANIPTYEVAVGDLCITEEGKIINADGRIVHSNDFSVNESSLTGESLSVFKNSDPENNQLYSGTIAVSGLAVFEVERIGKETRVGKIGTSIIVIKEEVSPLQVQIRKFVKAMAVVGIMFFLLVCMVSFYHSHDLIASLLNGLTLAMSILPEEIPVAFTTFMALGSWKLMQQGVIIKRSNIVETLGSTTVICTDKTGTITQNTMQLKLLYEHKSGQIFHEHDFNNPLLSALINYAMWSSEPIPFDPMEKTLHQVYRDTQEQDLRSMYTLFHEYPLEGKPPMMTHLFENEAKERIIAAKGAPEAILQVSKLSDIEKNNVRDVISELGQQGYRILGVAKAIYEGNNFPEKQQDFNFDFLGLVVFYDPPKQGINEVFQQIYEAGIKVKVITGDNVATTRSIATQAGIKGACYAIEGKDLIDYTDKELEDAAQDNVLFARMFPEAKLAVVSALKRHGEVVAMLGDGVNDGPALKAAHIGVAMGHKGTEIAKSAASLVITNDDLAKLITGIAAGRRIYTNIKKAIQYIISIHIPIILTVSLPLLFGWVFPQIFMPVHVIFLELVMGPTCSIVYENEPMEKNTMKIAPRPIRDTFLNWKELSISIVQGLIISFGVLFAYQFTILAEGSEEKTRAMVFTTLIFANILLSLVNRSFYYSVFECFKNRNLLLIAVSLLTILMLFAILYIAPISKFFSVGSLSSSELCIAATIASVSVLWFELFKLLKRKWT